MTTLFPSNLSGGEELPPPGVDVDQAAEGAASGEPFTATATSDDDLRYRVRADTLPDGSFWITAIPLTDVDDTMTRLITLEVVATGIILLLLAAVAWWVIRLGIRPIKQMTRTAEQIASGDLSHRVPEVVGVDRGRAARRRAQPDARPPRRGVHRASRVAGAAAALRRRRVP